MTFNPKNASTFICSNCGSRFDRTVEFNELFYTATLSRCPICTKQKSAFQRWFAHKCDCGGDSYHEDENIEGWNAAIEAVLNLEIKATGDVVFSHPRAILPDQVKKLIEE